MHLSKTFVPYKLKNTIRDLPFLVHQGNDSIPRIERHSVGLDGKSHRRRQVTGQIPSAVEVDIGWRCLWCLGAKKYDARWQRLHLLFKVLRVLGHVDGHRNKGNCRLVVHVERSMVWRAFAQRFGTRTRQVMVKTDPAAYLLNGLDFFHAN